jgi:hypothetical protein
VFDVSRVITGSMRLDVRPCVAAVMEAALDTIDRPRRQESISRIFDPRVGALMGDRPACSRWCGTWSRTR